MIGQETLYERAVASEMQFGHHFTEVKKSNDIKFKYFTPSHYFRPPHPLITEEVIWKLQGTNSRMLSVGCGPAILEQMLVSDFGLRKDQITLADISSEKIPQGYEFVQMDMQVSWPKLPEYDLIIFPESLYMAALTKVLESGIPRSMLKQVTALESHYVWNTITNAIPHLKKGGEIRIKDFMDKPVIESLARSLERPGLEMEWPYGEYAIDLISIRKKF